MKKCRMVPQWHIVDWSKKTTDKIRCSYSFNIGQRIIQHHKKKNFTINCDLERFLFNVYANKEININKALSFCVFLSFFYSCMVKYSLFFDVDVAIYTRVANVCAFLCCVPIFRPYCPKKDPSSKCEFHVKSVASSDRSVHIHI